MSRATALLLGTVSLTWTFIVRTVEAGSSQKPQPIRPPFVKVWEQEMRAQIDSYIVSEDSIFYGTFDSYGALDLATGRSIWEKVFTGGGALGARVALHDKVLYVAIGKSRLVACDTKSGDEIWIRRITGYASPIVVHSGLLFCSLDERDLTAVDVRDGTTKWSVQVDSSTPEQSKNVDLGVTAVKPVADGRLLVGTQAGELSSLSVLDGSILWRRSFEKPLQWWFGACVDDKNAYVVARDEQLIAVDLSNGSERWAISPDEESVARPPVSIDGHLIASSNGTIWSVDTAAGEPQWSFVVGGGHGISSPARNGSEAWFMLGTKLLSIDGKGNRLWEFDLEEDGDERPVAILSAGLLVAGYHNFYCYHMGAPPQLPVGADERKALASQLVARYDSLSKDDLRTLMKLGENAFEPMAELMEREFRSFEELASRNDAEFKDKRYELESRFRKITEHLAGITPPDQTARLLTVYHSGKTKLRDDVLRLIADVANENDYIPICVTRMNRNPKDRTAWPIVADSSHPLAVEAMIKFLRDERAPADVRHDAFVNLARTGGEAGLKAVLEFKDKERAINWLEQALPIAQLGTDAVADAKPSGQVQLRAVRRDASGILWGLVRSRALGSYDDLWIARHDGTRWTQPYFTDCQLKTLGDDDWFERFVLDRPLQRDSDGDGWTDVMERRLGTNPDLADSDGDGLKDSEDRNPLAAPRELNEQEQIVAAAFEAYHRFNSVSVPTIVQFPEDIPPFELFGLPGVIIPASAGSELRKHYGKGIYIVWFRAPSYDFDGTGVPKKKQQNLILWNEDRTEAKVHVAGASGGMAGSGSDVRLRKFGTRWVVISISTTWIS